MNIVDIIIAICLIAALIHGLIKGIILQIISIVSMILGIWASGRFASIVCDWMGQYFSGAEQVMKLIAFALIFIAVSIGLYFIGKLIEKVIKLATLGWANRLLGGLFSVFKWTMVLGVIVVAFNAINQTFNIVKQETLNESILFPLLTSFSDTVFPYIKNLLNA